MGTIIEAIAGFKIILADIDPSPQPVPENIYGWELDYESMDYTTFPFLIVAEVVNEEFSFTPQAQGVGYHMWDAEILTCLAPGPLTRTEAQADAETKHKPWIDALAEIFFNNQGVNGTALNIGDTRGLFVYRVGNLGWDNKIFWGIRCVVPVRQEKSLPSI